ncbi:MAG: flagellar motor protein MotB [Dongiaceae bacterium]
MPQKDQRPLIIKKIKKGHGHAHHGGAWKVAYADFVTAMMAFFLLLWLLNVTTDEQKLGIADYFAPSVASQNDTGSGGVLGGQTISADGALVNDTAAPSITIVLDEPAEELPEETDAEEEAGAAARPEPPKKPEEASEDTSPPTPPEAPQDLSEDTATKLVKDIEEERFRQAEFELRQAIQDIPDIQQLAQNLIIDRTPEGMRIQIVDQEKLSMFPRSSSDMLDHARKLMRLVAEVVRNLPNEIAITGHTDSTPFINDDGYGNWELSADRANASRRALMSAGVPGKRIASVIGKADKEPLVDGDRASPQNRRISIVLLHQTTPPTQPGGEPAASQDAHSGEHGPQRPL